MARLLIVDDEPDLRFTLQQWLLKRGHMVVEATNGREALKLAHTARPDLILLDLSMPEMDGFQTLVAIRQDEDLRSVPVVVLTAHDGISERVYMSVQGANDFLSKPIDWAKLERVLERLVPQG